MGKKEKIKGEEKVEIKQTYAEITRELEIPR
jgi:hypothetical protein